MGLIKIGNSGKRTTNKYTTESLKENTRKEF